MFMSQTQVSYQAPTSAIYERKFDTAMRMSFDRDMKERIAKENTILDDDLILKSKYLKIPIEEAVTSPDFYADILLSLLSSIDDTKVSSHLSRRLRRAYGIVNELVEIQHSYILSENYSNMRGRLNKVRSSFLSNRHYRKEIIKLVDMSLWLIKVIENLNLLNSPKYRNMDKDKKLEEMLKVNHARCPYMDMTLVWSFTKCLICIGTKTYLLPRPSILMVHNKICDLLSVLVMCIYGEGTCFPEDAYDQTLRYVKEMCYIMQKYKNKAFDIFKCLEGLGIAETLVQVENWKNTEFLDTLVDELRDNVKFDYHNSNIAQLLSEAPIPFRHELMCLSKIVGHPFVDMELGTEALHKATTEGLEINMRFVQQSLNYMKQNYIRNYIQQNGKWPPCQMNSPNAPTALTQAFVLGKDPHSTYIENNYGIVTVDDYIYIDILPNMQYHRLENSIPYLKDKTISVLRSRVMEMYVRNQNHSLDGIRTSWADTRCLLAFLIHPSLYHDHLKIMDKMAYNPNSLILLDYLVIRVVPKEKELKEIYRGFGCKTFEFRLGTLGQEKNVMRFLHDYSDEQAMTMSELDLLRRLRAFRSLYKAYPGYKIVYIVIDSSKWNNRFRPETVDIPMANFLDKIFDYPIFSKTHMMYEKSLIYVPDGSVVYTWDGQSGGIEGQNQDTWVVTYLAQLKVALEGLNIKYHLLCKGDDVRIAVAIPEKTLQTVSMREMKNLIVSRISSRMKEFGHIIKIEESYGSCRYFAFSKSASCDHVELPQGFRKIQKCYGASNAFIPTLDEYIAATFSNAHSSCKTEPITIPSYCTALFWMMYYLMQHPKYENLSDVEYEALALIPSMVGGFPIIYLHNMYVRAESDLLSPFIGLYKHCKKHYPDVADKMENFMNTPDIKDEDLDMLFRDPYALPSDRPQLPTTVLRSFIVPALEVLSKNNDVKQLIRASKDENHNIMMEVLRSAKPFNVKVLATLYSATPKGILEELMRKFESSRSINELVILRWGRRRAEKIILRVVRAESRLQGWRCSRIKGKNILQLNDYIRCITICPSESADRIRRYCWGRDIVGITMPPMQHQLQIHNAMTGRASNWVKNNHFTFNLKQPTINVSNQNHQHYCAFPSEPFVGYTTRTGNVAPSAHFIEKDPILTKVKNLFDLGSWVSMSKTDENGEMIDSNANEVVDVLLGCYTDIPRRQLDPFVSKRKSGTIQHHLRAPTFRESIVPNVLSNTMTWFSGESNSHLHLLSSPMHYRVNFLHCFCYAQWVMVQELEFSGTVTTPSVMWGVTTPCEYCNEPIVEDPIIFNIRLLRSISYEPLAILRIGEVAENIIRQSVVNWQKKQIRYDVTSKDLSYKSAAVGILQEMMDVTYYTRRSLETRYGGFHLGNIAYGIMTGVTLKSRSREIGLTELKRLSIENLGEYLVQIVAPTFEYLAMSRGPHQEHFLLSECPPQEFPWYGLIVQIFKAGKLGPLIRWLNTRTDDPPPACHNSPVGAAAYIGRTCAKIDEYQGGPAICVVLSYYNSGHLKNHLLSVGRYCIWRIYRIYFRDYLLKQKKTTDDNVLEAIKKLIRQSFCLSYMYDTIEEAVSECIDDLLAKTEDICFMPDMYDLDADIIDLHIDDKPNNRIMRSLQHLSSRLDMTLDDVGRITAEDVDGFIETAVTNRQSFSVEIVYSTLEQCISAVRNLGVDEIIAARDKEELEMEHPTISDRIDLVPRHDLPHIHYDFKPGTTDPILYEYHPHIEPLDDLLYTVDKSHVFRLLGSSNGSESYFAEIMIDTGLENRIPMQGNYACLADGVGGACNVIAALTAGQCIILYHTLIENDIYLRYPDAMLDNFPNMIDQVLVSHLHQGYSHLNDEVTWLEMEKYGRLYALTTCDIELKNNELATYNVIFQNLCVFFLRNRMFGGVLICRVNLYNTINLDTMVSILSNYCTYLQVYRPRSMKRFKWAYLIAAGHRKNFNDTYETYKWKPDPVYCQRVQAFQQLLKTNMNQNDRALYRLIRVPRADTMHLLKYMNMLPNRFYSLCRNLLNINVRIPEEQSLNNMFLDLAYNWGTETLNKYGLNVLPKINHWLTALTQDNLPSLYMNQVWSTDTQAHRLHCINNLMTLCGFRYGCCLMTSIDVDIMIDHHDYLGMFDSIIQMLPSRDQYSGSHTEMMQLGYQSKGIHIVFGCYFIRGIHTFLTLYGCMRALWLRQESLKKDVRDNDL